MQIVDLSPREDNTTRHLPRTLQSVSGKALCCALHPNGGRAYLGGHSGVWRSDDSGATWAHLEWPQPPGTSTAVPGALLGTTVYDLAISPANPDVVLAAVAKDARLPSAVGIWRSADGGATWTRVHQFVQNTIVGQANCLSIAPDDANLVFAAGGFSLARSVDGGVTWTTVRPGMPGENVWYVAVAPLDGAVRRVYAIGARVWHSEDGGVTWAPAAQVLRLGASGDGAGAGARSLSVHPGDPRTIFITTFERNDAIDNTEGIVWRGTFDSEGNSRWVRLPPIPLNYPQVTASGAGFVVPVVDAVSRELLLVASDRRTVHVAVDPPQASTDWVRVEDEQCHVDPHGFAASRIFTRPSGPTPGLSGHALLVNDGGANVSRDGMHTWTNATGLPTLGLVNAAVIPQTAKPAAVCMGMGDNSGFATPDGGGTWETQHYLGGDNDCAFSDPRQSRRAVVFAPRAGKGDGGVGEGVVFLYTTTADRAPDTSHGTTEVRAIPGAPPLPSKILEALNSDNPSAELNKLDAAWNVVSFFHAVGYKPLVMTLASEPVPDDVDFVAVRFTDALPELVRTTKLSRITDAQFWETNATADGPNVRAFKVGPPLPSAAVSVVQASGGHASTTFYVGEQDTARGGSRRVWKWAPGLTAWQPIVPAPASRPPQRAQRFFVDPYRPNLIYVLAIDHVYRSNNGGSTWVVDTALERALTENGAFPLVIPDDGNPAPALLRDMQFDPRHPGHRYAVGPAGVFQTLDGVRWTCLLRSSAAACRPMNLAYDFESCPRALYVATSNRGILKLAPLPPEWDFPVGSLQAAIGRLTLLRIHDVGTGFGPPGDRLDGEIVVFLDTQPEKSFGLRLRADANRPAAEGMLGVLRDAFNRNRVVRLEFVRTGCRTGRIVRVIEQ